MEADGELVLRTDTLRTGHSGSSQPDPGAKSPPAAGGRHSQGISSLFPFQDLVPHTPSLRRGVNRSPVERGKICFRSGLLIQSIPGTLE